LTEIDISGNCGVTDDGISELYSSPLLKINVSSNMNITNLNYLKKLTEIDVGTRELLGFNYTFNCGVGDAGISELSYLKKIKANGNQKITNLNCFAKTLTEIDIIGNCGVSDPGICELENLLIINAYRNHKIKNLVRKHSVSTA
jgi:hypothetical protein